MPISATVLNPAPSVFAFTDYRRYLRAVYQHRKRMPGGFTYARFSKEAGMASPNFIALVMDGKKNLTVSNILRVADSLKLNSDETSYFEAVALANQAKEPRVRTYYLRRADFTRSRTPGSSTRLKPREEQKNWYFLATLLSLHGRLATTLASEIAIELGIRTDQAERSIESGLKLGLLEERDGRLYLTQDHVIWHDSKLSNIHQKEHLRAQLSRSQTAFDRTYETGAKFSASTFTMGKTSIDHYMGRIQAFIATLVAEADREPTEKVVQLNIQLFSLADRPRE